MSPLKALAALAMLALAACSTAEPKWAPDAAVAAAHYVKEGPKTITLFTVVNNRSGQGAHSGLLINASERVMFDPAGTWYHSTLPERNDVHFGVTDRMVDFYIDYHARETFRVIEQTVVVSPEVAEMVLRKAEAYGAVPKAQCAKSISAILAGVPGFESIPQTWFPNKISEAFAKLPGATMQVFTDDDAPNNHGVLMVQQKTEVPATPKDEH
jgi:hypothetical protein